MLNVQNVVLLIFIFIACLANILTNVKFRYCKSRCCKTQISISEFKSIHLFSDSLHYSQFSCLVQEQILGWWLVRDSFDHHIPDDYCQLSCGCTHGNSSSAFCFSSSVRIMRLVTTSFPP